MRQHVGVELAPGQLGDELLGARAPVPGEVGEQSPRVDAPPPQRRRQLAGAVQVGAIALGGVALQAVVEEGRPPRQRGRLTRRLWNGIGLRPGRQFLRPHTPGEPDAGGVRLWRRPAVLAPGAQERGEHAVGRAHLSPDAARCDRVRRVGRHQRNRRAPAGRRGLRVGRLPGQRGRDLLVGPDAARREVRRHVHRGRPHLAGDLGYHPGRVAHPHDESPVVGPP